MDSFDAYLNGVSQLLLQLPRDDIVQVIDVLERARAEGRRVFVFGNGGSAATAAHLVCDLVKNTVQEGKPRFRAISLNDNMSTISAYANDCGYETVFAEPLVSLAAPGDVAIGISASGNSANVLRAMDVAQGHGLVRIGFTGYEGGKLKDKVDVCVIVPSEDMQQIEDAHLVIAHVIFRALCQGSVRI
ncbi:MAG: SIS domain-containing protein [Chloroflexi bacterium]|nr:SIS domain-containing protein [Chloroflexota bacterium]